MTNISGEELNKCRELISDAKAEEALDILHESLSNFSDETISLKSRLVRLKKEKRADIIPTREYNQEYQKIIQSMLDLIRDVESQINRVKRKKTQNSSISTEQAHSVNTKYIYLIIGVIILSSIAVGSFFLFRSKQNLYFKTKA